VGTEHIIGVGNKQTRKYKHPYREECIPESSL